MVQQDRTGHTRFLPETNYYQDENERKNAASSISKQERQLREFAIYFSAEAQGWWQRCATSLIVIVFVNEKKKMLTKKSKAGLSEECTC